MGGFHKEKKAIIGTFKWEISGDRMEAFIPHNGLSESQYEHFGSFENARQNRRFFIQLAAASVIKL